MTITITIRKGWKGRERDRGWGRGWMFGLQAGREVQGWHPDDEIRPTRSARGI